MARAWEAVCRLWDACRWMAVVETWAAHRSHGLECLALECLAQAGATGGQCAAHHPFRMRRAVIAVWNGIPLARMMAAMTAAQTVHARAGRGAKGDTAPDVRKHAILKRTIRYGAVL